jgi:hypothetical protein
VKKRKSENVKKSERAKRKLFHSFTFSLFTFPKVFCDSVKAYQNPEKFYDECGEIEIVNQRNDDEARARRVQQRVVNAFAFYSPGLQ